MSNLRLEVTAELEVKVFVGDAPEPALYQPNYPDGSAFESFSKANTWGLHFIESSESRDKSYPADSPGGKRIAQPPISTFTPEFEPEPEIAPE
jgi:hypothetical protein